MSNYQVNGQVYSPAFSEPSSPMSVTSSAASEPASPSSSPSRPFGEEEPCYVSKKPRFANKYEERLQPLSPVLTIPCEVRCQRPKTRDTQLQLQFESVIAAGQVTKIEDFLNRHSTKISINQYNSEGRTALQQSCLEGQLSMAKVLVKFGADHRLTTRDGFSTLHLAVFSGQSSVMTYIMSLKH